jgi:hypothetical protein
LVFAHREGHSTGAAVGADAALVTRRGCPVSVDWHHRKPLSSSGHNSCGRRRVRSQ